MHLATMHCNYANVIPTGCLNEKTDLNLYLLTNHQLFIIFTTFIVCINIYLYNETSLQQNINNDNK